MTQDLRQSIELLSLSNMELSERLQRELMENPLLEEVSLGSEPNDPAPEFAAPPPQESGDDPEFRAKVSDPPDTGFRKEPVNYERTESKHQFLQNAVEAHSSLQDHLLAQLRLLNLTSSQFKAGEYLISCIDERGFIDEEPRDLLKGFSLSDEELAGLLDAIYNLDPIGCATRSIAHSLSVQAAILRPDDQVARLLLEKYFDRLEELDYETIEEESGLSPASIDAALRFIRTLEPYPGSRYSDRPPAYIIPELRVLEFEGKLEVLLHDEGIPRLRIDLENAESISRKQSPEDKEYIQSKLTSAEWLIQGIEHRKATLLKVMRSILNFQEAYFREGPSALRPLTLREVADDIEMHESTVSRITTNKYVETRWGIVELKYFFSSAVRSENGTEDYSSTGIQERIKKLVEEEDPKAPLSDQAIANLLKEEGIKIARRTVAKYRNNLQILPADRRKRLHRITTG